MFYGLLGKVILFECLFLRMIRVEWIFFCIIFFRLDERLMDDDWFNIEVWVIEGGRNRGVGVILDFLILWYI